MKVIKLGGSLLDDVDIFAGAAQGPVEDAIVPSGDGLVGHTKPEQEPPAQSPSPVLPASRPEPLALELP